MEIAVARLNSNGQLVRLPISPKMRASLIVEADFTCRKCNNKFPEDDLEIDHIYPTSRGGLNQKTNLQVLCVRCHSEKRGLEKKLPQRGIQLQLKLGSRNWASAKVGAFRVIPKSEIERINNGKG